MITLLTLMAAQPALAQSREPEGVVAQRPPDRWPREPAG